MTAQPTLGPDVAPGGGWTVVAVRIENADPVLAAGEVEIVTEQSPTPVVRAPFSVAPGATAVLRVPVHAENAWQFTARLRARSGKVLAEQPLRAGTPTDPVLVEVFEPPRLPAGLRGAKVPVRYHPSYSSAATLPLSLGAVTFDATTGDPVLPTRAAEYGPTTALVVPSDVLSRVGGAELEALASWVLSGGTLAVSIKRPEDLRAPALVAMLGGEPRDGGPARQLAGARAPGVQKDASGTVPPAVTAPLPPPPDEDEDEHPHVVPPPAPTTQKPVITPQVTIGKELGEALVAYTGGNLAPSDFGATAAYGLGEVHLLAFDPWRPGALDDAWVQSRMVELTRHAWDRRAAQVFDRGRQGAYASPGASDLRRLLDPNEGARWAVVVAALLLFAYSVVSGPVNFALARNRGRPLSALVALPLMSLGAFLLIVLLGVVSRGVRGQARHLALVEAGGGMTKGAIRRYRGFFTPSAKRLGVRATDTGTVIDVLSDSSKPGSAELLVERGGLQLANLATLPWQTVVAREDGTATLGGGVSLVRDGADVRVINRSSHALRGVLVHVPRRGVFHFSSLKDGAAVLGTSGTLLLASPTTSYSRGALPTHPLSASTFSSAWTKDGGERLARAWTVMESVTRPRQADWWPEDVPVLLAQADGGEGATSDAGLGLSEDRVLVRVVGWGGAP